MTLWGMIMLQIPEYEYHTKLPQYITSHTKLNFGMTIVVILYDIHTLEFAAQSEYFNHNHNH